MQIAQLDNAHTHTQKHRVTSTKGVQRVRGIALVALLAALAASGCSSSGETACTANDQCPSGQACRAGECVTLDTMTMGDAGRRDASARSDGAVQENPDAGSAGDAGDAGMMGPGECQFNDDGVLTAEELPLALNVESRFVEARGRDGGVPVNLMGAVDNSGHLTWDFSGALPGDGPATITAKPLSEFWFGPEFQDGQYAVPLDGTGENFGIFRRTANSVDLLGVASRDPDYTLLKYEPEVTVLKFPMMLNQTFSSEVHTSGTFQTNAFYTSTDTYHMTVDAQGDVVTPAGRFPVLRLRIEQTVSVPIFVWPFSLDYKYVQYSFMAACYSQVAHVASMQDEEELNFTHAASVRRLGLTQ